MDWIGVIALLAGIIMVGIGIALALNLPAIMFLVEELVGVLAIILGVIMIFFGSKLVRT